MPGTHILILGGTAEARQLAAELTEPTELTELTEPTEPTEPTGLTGLTGLNKLTGLGGFRVTTSLAGRVSQPRLPAGEVRIGGFGGPEGLARWLREQSVDAVVDATHPFAAAISAGAAQAAAAVGVPLCALRRPGWSAGPGDCWYPAASLADAAAQLPALGRRIFLTTGRLGLAAFADLGQLRFLVRSVEPPEPPLPRHTHILLDRGPFTVDGERELLRTHEIDVLVTKDSGGPATAAKLSAARELEVPVVVVRRPPAPPDVPVAPDVAGVLGLLGVLLSRAAADRCP
ncbi:cobalt-precorrin-6A reductase [Streptomyces lunaelactis]|uniref:cobalt-precorrin-6A reductase n=1 Tax=Streptomyces lunaelactis TaxID=1535768 RepID=UPI001585B067|nr:cobalt-precorrin-6A reductase [Streptomyces lunaelactis]NUK01468.1 cobalt-precorrin-6A reductase [Streptomyces lunaelactis]NUK17075.1 cobalt-precorrin-6A reductase [Streptomyces lunaelactis]NUK52589.1 cobalt-precorrin-6A reductase [Streptomyces lunaelactis]NUK66374.1 cobalt-precorrin-6A reductase [Streptomyces lunaelactis]